VAAATGVVAPDSPAPPRPHEASSAIDAQTIRTWRMALRLGRRERSLSNRMLEHMAGIILTRSPAAAELGFVLTADFRD
jgi:hypothetical protein